MVFSTTSLLVIVTDIGDSACHLALVLAASVYLLARGSKRAALFLTMTFLLSVVAIGILKVSFIGCHERFPRLNIHSPSGHTALSAAVFGAVACLMRSQLEARRRALPMVLSTLLIIAIAVTRVMLGDHSVAEVIIGLFTGLLSVWVAKLLVWRAKTLVPFDAYVLLLWCMVAIFLAHGHHLPGENIVQMLASHLNRHAAACVIPG